MKTDLKLRERYNKFRESYGWLPKVMMGNYRQALIFENITFKFARVFRALTFDEHSTWRSRMYTAKIRCKKR